MRKVQSHFGAGPLQQKISVGELSLLADAELSCGGTDTGPSPHEYLAAALASCTSMTLKMYSERKAWSLKDVIVTVDITCENQIEYFSRNIELLGEINEEQKERLLDIANKCPIHQSLSGKIQVKTQLVN